MCDCDAPKADFVAASRLASMSSIGCLALIEEVNTKSAPGLSGLHEPIGEAIGLALDRGIERLDRVRIVLVREHGAFRVQHEAGRLHLLADGCRLNPMQRLGVTRARPDGGGVVYDDVGPTRFQPLVDSSIEVSRRRAPGLDQ